MRNRIAVLAIAIAVAGSSLVRAQEEHENSQKVSIHPMPFSEQEAFLKTLVTKQKDGKIWALVHPYIVATQTVESNARTVCSTNLSARTPQAGPAAGEQWYGGSSTVCRDLISRGNATVLAFPDPDKTHGAAYLVFLSCHETPAALHNLFRAKMCMMQEPGQYGSMTIEEGNHGRFDVWVATVEKLGGRPKASNFDIVEVKLAELQTQKGN